MPRRVACYATALACVALVGAFFAGLFLPQPLPAAASMPSAPVLPALPAVGSGAAAADAPLHPVVIQHPETLGVLDTELLDVRGIPVGISCDTCHADGARPAIASRQGAPEAFHAGVEVVHGSLRCNSCHHPDDRTKLRLADGTALAVDEVMQLCAQCHGPQTRDYEFGSHGGMAGYWDRTRGPQLRNSCVACHASHQPAYPRVIPAAPPRDRFLPPHPEPRPAARLPGRDLDGVTPHE